MTPNEQLFNLCRGNNDNKQDYKKIKEKFLELLSKGADVNYVCEKGYFDCEALKDYRESCLYASIFCENYYLAYLLLTHGTKYNLTYTYRNNDILFPGDTVMIDGGNILKLLFEARLDHSTNRKVKALFDFVFNKAVKNEDYEAIYNLYKENSILPKEYIEKMLVNANEDDEELPYYKYLFLAHSIYHGRTDMIKLLLQYGAKADKKLVEDYVEQNTIYSDFKKVDCFVNEEVLALLNHNLQDEQTM